MQKLFFTICFLFSGFANAAVISITSPQQAEQIVAARPQNNVSRDYNNLSQEEWADFLQERFEKVRVEAIPLSARNSAAGTTSAEPAEELIEDNKTQENLFEKMYKDAIKRFDQSSKAAPTLSQPFQAQQNVNYQSSKDSLGFPTLSVKIPDFNKVVKVPAQPHIPYFFSDIEVLSSGAMLIEETILVLNNSAQPYQKVISKYLTNRNNGKQKLNVDLLGVSINGEPVDYEIKESFSKLFMAAKSNQRLPSGVYEYKFRYVIENNFSSYKDVDEFLFNIVGYNTLLISRAGAVISFPKEFGIINESSVIEFGNTLRTSSVATLSLYPNTTAFISTIPILPSNSFFVISSIQKDGITSISFSTSFWSFVNSYSDTIFALLGFLVIFGAYLLSAKEIGKKNSKQSISIKKTAPMQRLLFKDVCDITSLGAFILELYKKNIIDIIKNDDTILLVKKTDQIKGLQKYEKQSLQELFSNKESVLSITSYNILKLKRALQQLSKGLSRSLQSFIYKLNARYILFSSVMLCVSIIGVASGHINSYQVFIVCIIISTIFCVLAFAFCIRIKQKYAKYALRTTLALASLFLCLLLSNFISTAASVFILSSIATIFAYSKIFTQKSGLIQNYIKEVDAYRSSLEKNIAKSLSPKDALIQQANIFALDLTELLDKYSSNENNKTNLIKEIINIYNRKK